MNLVSGFEEHLRNIVISLLDSMHKDKLPCLATNETESSENIIKYVAVIDNFKIRRVSPKPRKIHYSHLIKSNSRYSACIKRIKKLELFLENGDQRINQPEHRFLSAYVEYIFNRTEDPSWLLVDKMLYEWGIMHFHLGQQERTNDLLFAMIDEDNAYFIDIRGHHSLYEQELLNIVYENWPHLLEFLNGISGTKLSEQEVKVLRKKNCNHAPDIDGKALYSKNTVSATGIPIRIVREVDIYSSKLNELEKMLNDENSDVYKDIKRQVAKHAGKLNFELINDVNNFQDSIVLVEKNTNSVINVNF